MPQANPRKSTTIYEIAQRAGVSSSTVARVLRGDVKETWKSTAKRADRIRRLAQEMGYRTNWRARAFSEQRTWTMGLLYTEAIHVFDGVHGQMVTGFNDQLRADGYHLLLLPAESKQFEDVVLGSRLDGCAMLSHMLPGDAGRMVADSGLPAVVLNGKGDDQTPHVEVDDFEGGFIAAEHLLGLGHRRIVFYVSASADAHYSIADRRRGVEAALRKAGVPVRGVFQQVTQEQIMERVLDPQAWPTGMICYSQAESMPLLSAMYAHRLRIPEVMSVVSFNDVQSAKLSSPPLTTLAYDAEQLGRVGAKMLLELFERGDNRGGPVPVRTLSHRLSVRASTGPAPTSPRD